MGTTVIGLQTAHDCHGISTHPSTELVTGGLVEEKQTFEIPHRTIGDEKKAALDCGSIDGKMVDAEKNAATTAISPDLQDKQSGLEQGKGGQRRAEQEDATAGKVSAGGDLAGEEMSLPQYVRTKSTLHDNGRRATLIKILKKNSPNRRDKKGACEMNLLDSTYAGKQNLGEEQQLWGNRVRDAGTREKGTRGKDRRVRSGNLHGTSGIAPSLSEFKVTSFQPLCEGGREGGRERGKAGRVGAGSVHN